MVNSTANDRGPWIAGTILQNLDPLPEFLLETLVQELGLAKATHQDKILKQRSERE